MTSSWWGIAQFFIALLPVLGFVSFNYQTYSFAADHFLYLSCIGGGLLLAVGGERLSEVAGYWLGRRELAMGILGLLIAGCGMQTYAEATHWHDDLAFWSRVHERDPNGFLGNFNLANHFRRDGQWAAALPFYQRALEIRPRADYAFQLYAEALRQTQGPQTAIDACTAKLERDPDLPSVYMERGRSYDELGDSARAARDYSRGRQLAGAAQH